MLLKRGKNLNEPFYPQQIHILTPRIEATLGAIPSMKKISLCESFKADKNERILYFVEMEELKY
jgi:hypothetical protein